MKRICVLLLILSGCFASAQLPTRDKILQNSDKPPTPKDTAATRNAHHYDVKNFEYWYAQGDTLHMDTALTMQHYYEMNYTLRDQFAFMPFSNIGQPLNPLTYDRHYACIPAMGFYAKQMNYWMVDTIPYYNVKKPFTKFQFNTGIRHGHALNALFSYNPNSRLNLTFDYNGLRSLGNYLNQLSSTQRFLFSTNYHTRSGRYQIYGHYIAQGINNEENGGVSDRTQFESGNPRYANRANMPTRLSGAITQYEGTRFYAHQEFKLFKPPSDSLYERSPLALYHSFEHESKRYDYHEKQDNSAYDNLLGPADKKRRSAVRYETLSNELGLSAKLLKGALQLQAGLAYTRLDYRLDTAYTVGVYQTSRAITDAIFTPRIKLHAAIAPHLALGFDAAYNIAAQRFKGAHAVKAALSYTHPAVGTLQAGLAHTRAYPDMLWQLYRGFYSRLIWETHFPPLQISKAWVKLRSESWLDLKLDLTDIAHYVYMDPTYRVRQLRGSVTLFRLQAHKDLKLWQPSIQGNVWKLQCDNTLLYQRLLRGGKVLPLPAYVTRNTLYFQGDMFKKALNAQFGIGFYQFASFPSRRYSPFLNTFVPQGQPQNIGGYPIFDLFVNGKVDRFRWTLKLQHFNADYTGYRYYSAPDYPYMDWKIRVAIIWFLVN